MSATATFFSVRAPVRVRVAQPKRSTACRAAAKETSVKAEDFKYPLACDASKEADGAFVVEMAKAKCVHPERPVAKVCKDCPRR